MKYRVALHQGIVRLILYSFLVILLGTASGCQEPAVEQATVKGDAAELAAKLGDSEPGTPVIDLEITQVSLQELKDVFNDLFNKPKAADTVEQVVERTLQLAMDRNYLYLEALERGINVDPDIQKEWEIIVSFWLGDYFMRDQLGRMEIDIEVVDAMLPEDYMAYDLSVITVRGLTAAQDLRNRLIKGAEFKRIAEQYSIDPAARKGGLISETQIMGLANIYGEELLYRLAFVEEGDLSQVIETPMGYAIFRVNVRRPLTDGERNSFRESQLAGLRANIVQQYLGKVQETYPLTVYDDALERAIVDQDPETVVAQVGENEINFDYARAIALRFLNINDRPNENTLEQWVEVLNQIHPKLALYQLARSEDFQNDERVKENLARMEKRQLAMTMINLVLEESVPTDEQLYSYYLELYGDSGEEAFFSLEGLTGLSKEDALKAKDGLETGMAVSTVKGELSADTQRHIVSGTYKESDLRKGLVPLVEKTPVGEVTPPFYDGASYSIYRVMGKKRGEAPLFDTLIVSLTDKLKQKMNDENRKSIVYKQNEQHRLKYIYPKETLVILIERWLNLQKALRGVSPPGGYHGGSTGGPSITVPGDRKMPAGHP